MKVTFRVRYATRPGQILRITGTIPLMGGNQTEQSRCMQYQDEQCWSIVLDIPAKALSSEAPVTYRYILEQEGGDWIEEWDIGRKLLAGLSESDRLLCIDVWNHAGDVHQVFFSAPFQQVLLGKREEDKQLMGLTSPVTHHFRVRCPLLQAHEELCLTGSDPGLGSWNKMETVGMKLVADCWEAAVDLSGSTFPLTYKYAVRDRHSGRLLRYEDGDNRLVSGVADAPSETRVVLHDGVARFPYDTWRGTGIAIPVFSLRSEEGFGVGEFSDIPKLVDWAVLTGIRMIQILPVNDTTSTGTWTDSYPYSAISAFALHPLYLNLQEAAGSENAHLLTGCRTERIRLNGLPDVDYEAVMRYKLDKIAALYEAAAETIFASKGYGDFYQDNAHWLAPYVTFCHLRDEYGSPYPSDWKEHATYDPEFVQECCDPANKSFRNTGLYLFTQYLLHCQLSHAHAYANRHGIILKGDIPIGVNRQGVEAWMEPALFDLDMQAGAPPDDFAIKGQNWGFPTYRWQQMQEDGYEWWKRRFSQMSRYFDAFRIDHILGFFRIWSIPTDAVEGIMGRFVPAVAVRPHEFTDVGINFDAVRYCQPYITDVVLWEMFGQDAILLRPFLSAKPDGTYRLLEEVATQRAVAQRITGQDAEAKRLRQGLFDLISNVLMFEEPGSMSTAFHFRFNMSLTLSYKHLRVQEKASVQALYIDYFFRRQDEKWKREALRKLPALKRSTDMLICGEDLGLVPSCVPAVMSELGILSMEVQRMPKDPGQEFFHPAKAPYLSVVTPSSHDMSTVRGWWKEDPARIHRFFVHELGQYAQAPVECEPWVVRSIIRQHLQSPAQWAVFQFQDLIGMNGELRLVDPTRERINEPSNPQHYWRYRMHLTLESLLNEDGFNDLLATMIEDSGRKH